MHGVLLVLIGSTGIGLHIGETEHVSHRQVLGLVEAMASFAKERTGRAVIVDSADWEQCRGRGPCLDSVRARTGASDVVVVRVIAGPLTLHVASERFYFDVDATRTSSASLPKDDQSGWNEQLERMVARLFPEPPRIAPSPPPPPPSIVEETEPPPLDEPSIAPWVLLGASGAVAAVGVGFGISNRVANGRIEGQVVTFDQRAELEDRARTHGITATVLFGTAAAGAITALLWYALD